MSAIADELDVDLSPDEVLGRPRKRYGAEAQTHDALEHDLAIFMEDAGQIVAERFQLPHGGQQIDVLTIAPYKYASPDIRAYEVKASVADFRADERRAKWTGYLRYANRVFFACEAGLLKAEMIPTEAGLITKGKNGWSVVKAARYHGPAVKGWDNDAWMALLSRRREVQLSARSLRDRVNWEENAKLSERAKNIGYQIATALRNKEVRADGLVVRDHQAEQLKKIVVDGWPGISEYQRTTRLKALLGMDKNRAILSRIGAVINSIDWGDEKQLDAAVDRLEKELETPGVIKDGADL